MCACLYGALSVRISSGTCCGNVGVVGDELVATGYGAFYSQPAFVQRLRLRSTKKRGLKRNVQESLDLAPLPWVARVPSEVLPISLVAVPALAVPATG